MPRQYDVHIPTMDNHCHLCFPEPIDQSLRGMEEVLKKLSISRIGLLSVPRSSHNEPCHDILENLKVLYIKDRLSLPCHAYTGCVWHGDDPALYLQQGKEAMEMGFDAFKFLEMHPRVRKEVGKGLNHPSFSALFSYANELGSVVLCHVGDPRASWDKSTASPTAIALGRVYGDGHQTLDELYAEMEEVIARYPRIRFVLAHFYFISDHYENACRLMEKYPNVYLDLTPGGEMYVNFCKNPELWREFFLRYQDRIILGSDLYAAGYGDNRHELARNFLEGNEPFEYVGHIITPMPMPREVLDKIYMKNILSLLGDSPKKVDREKAYAQCLHIQRMHPSELSPLGRENLETMLNYWR